MSDIQIDELLEFFLFVIAVVLFVGWVLARGC